ncbi:hypothetical protein CRG98_034755 [Punica granatum]|uniref:Prefoldin subunit 4 n=1 Tax=Punica granatum TaxID=22663 RepID=A0A2I0ILE1_PUNGR|nr:hypothetical protein CRG98_034755 [Punica granatum]
MNLPLNLPSGPYNRTLARSRLLPSTLLPLELPSSPAPAVGNGKHATELVTLKGADFVKGGGSETEVTWEDQQNINRFSKLNNRFHELEDEIKAAKERNDNLEDASNELILTDEEVVRFQIGEVFAHVPKDEVEERIEQMKEVTTKNLEKLEEEKESVLAQMAELKKILYAKFKDSINLEED